MSKSMLMINSVSSGSEYWERLSFTAFEILSPGAGRASLILKAERLAKVWFPTSEHSELQTQRLEPTILGRSHQGNGGRQFWNSCLNVAVRVKPWVNLFKMANQNPRGEKKKPRKGETWRTPSLPLMTPIVPIVCRGKDKTRDEGISSCPHFLQNSRLGYLRAGIAPVGLPLCSWHISEWIALGFEWTSVEWMNNEVVQIWESKAATRQPTIRPMDW